MSLQNENVPHEIKYTGHLVFKIRGQYNGGQTNYEEKRKRAQSDIIWV